MKYLQAKNICNNQYTNTYHIHNMSTNTEPMHNDKNQVGINIRSNIKVHIINEKNLCLQKYIIINITSNGFKQHISSVNKLIKAMVVKFYRF